MLFDKLHSDRIMVLLAGCEFNVNECIKVFKKKHTSKQGSVMIG